MSDTGFSFDKPTSQIGQLDSVLPMVHVPQHGMMDAIGQLFGDTTGSMWLSMTQGKGKGGGNAMGIPEDADEAMQQAMMIAKSGNKVNLNDVGNLIGDAAGAVSNAASSLGSSILSLFA